ncbi:RNA polymerase sigma factor [bacterium SCSIO 12643]|nr:RNA polymerase sigma factor [bacterium SCSIO 12643]
MPHKEQYFKTVLSQSKDKIYRLCLGYTGNRMDADDLFQDISIKIWQNLSSFRAESHIDTWIYRIATNTALLYVRKKKRIHKTSDITREESDLVDAEVHGLGDSEDNLGQLYKSISSLKEMDRIIISLVLEGHSYLEIAEITGMSMSNVGVKINRIKKALAVKMRSYG